MLSAGILVAPVLLPVAAGVLLPRIRSADPGKSQRRFLCGALVLNLLSVVAVFVLSPGRLVLLPLSPDLTLALGADLPGLLFCALAAAMFLLVGIYALPYMAHEGDEARFYSFYLVVLGLLSGIGLSDNLLTLYLFFEFMTLCSMPLVLHNRSREAIGAAFRYLFYSIAGASMGLIGLFYVYASGGSLGFVAGGVPGLAGGDPALLVVTLLAIVGFGAKAGMFPLHAWLPTAHPVAPAPASAVLSGVITKAGVFAVFRFVFYIVGADRIRGTWVQTAWMTLALLTVFMGSMLAFKEPLLKKRFAYSSISQVSYILFGLATLSPDGVTGSLLHILFHSLAKNALFMMAGAIILYTGKTHVADLVGIGRSMPFVMGCFSLTAIAMVGIPPTAGFLSKWYLATGALGADIGVFRWLGPVVLLLSALLTAGYLLPIAIRAFFPGEDAPEPAPPWRWSSAMGIPIALLTAALLVFGLFPAPLLGLVGSMTQAIL